MSILFLKPHQIMHIIYYMPDLIFSLHDDDSY